MKVMCKEVEEIIRNFFSTCADNYHKDKDVRLINRLGLLTSALFTLGSYLEINNPTVKLGKDAVLGFATVGIIFGLPILVNFSRERKGDYNNPSQIS